MTTLELWKAHAKVFADELSDGSGMKTFSQRILALISLIDKKDEKLKIICEKFPYSKDPIELAARWSAMIMTASDALALTENLK